MTRHEHEPMIMHPVMNDTKWNEVRLAMHELESIVRWRTRDRHSGFVSGWDADWYYHFRVGGYDTIEWVEIRPDNPSHRPEILEVLRRIGVPGRVDEVSITVYGYVPHGQSVDRL